VNDDTTSRRSVLKCLTYGAAGTAFALSGGIDGGDRFSFKFDRPGTYKYVCSIHPQMMGTVTVQ